MRFTGIQSMYVKHCRAVGCASDLFVGGSDTQ